MAPPLLTLRDLRFGLGGKPLFAGLEMVLRAGERIALVGRNGAGKSTLLRLAAGELDADAGERFLHPRAQITRLDQAPDLSGGETVEAALASALPDPAQLGTALGLLAELGMTGTEATATLSGGERKRAALARALAADPDLLFLDEPTNHLDLPAIGWLEEALRRHRAGMLIISHDRRFLATVADAVLWLDRGSLRRLDHGFAAFEAWRDRLLEEEEAIQHKLSRQIAREDDWLRYGVTARRKRNVRRLEALHALRRQQREHRGPQGIARLEALAAEATSGVLLEAKGVHFAFAERAIVTGFDLRLGPRERLGIVGANGAGKTTLVRLLTGTLAPQAGTVRAATTLAVATLDQMRAGLDPRATVEETLTDGAGDRVVIGGQSRHVASVLKDFLFEPRVARQPVGALSGGEQARLALARVLSRPANLLVLDEPTNDLDLETLDALEEMLAEFPGAVLLVSHDRDLLDRVCTRVVLAEGDGRWSTYPGGYSDMVAQRGEGLILRPAERRPDVTAATPKAPDVGTKSTSPAGRPPGLSAAETRQLEALTERLGAIDRDIAKLEALLADPDLYNRDPARHGKASAVLAALLREKEEGEERWLTLAQRAEEAGTAAP